MRADTTGRSLDEPEIHPVATGYAGYTEWKGWQGSFQTTPQDARYFQAEFAGLPLADRDVLEIGFGDGRFLAWARAQGARVTGIEINAEMLAAATGHGFAVRNAQFADLADEGLHYDLIVAFDVLEHWDFDALVANMLATKRLLRAGGRLLARFPNGHSPFGRVYQYGDFTHRSVLSCYRIGYLASISGLEVVRLADAQRVPSKPGWSRALRYRWRAWQREWIERRIARLYGTERLPLGPNLVAVLQKPEVAAVDESAGMEHHRGFNQTNATGGNKA